MFLPEEKLFVMGFKHIGQNVKISDRAVFYNIGGISIGDNNEDVEICYPDLSQFKIFTDATH